MVNNNHPVDIPKTYTVSYFNENEWNKDLTPQEIAQQQELTDLQNQLGGNEKGYGPCSWDNPDCECYISASEGRYVPLYLVCPAPKDRYPWCTAKTPGQFTHGNNNCGGRRYINTDLMVKCMKCGSVNHVTKSVFRCSIHKDDEYIGASKSEFGKALTILNNLSKNKGEVTRIYISKMVKKVLEEEGFEY